MSNLAFNAAPIDFGKNDKLDTKIDNMKKSKLNKNLLMNLTSNKEAENNIDDIHNNTAQRLKEENESTLADFYNEERKNDLKRELEFTKHDKNMIGQKQSDKGAYLISNNLNVNKINGVARNQSSTLQDGSNQALMKKLNYIIDLFEDQKEIKTNQKNEEIVMYCFLGVFVIYVLDSFVYIGKYSR